MTVLSPKSLSVPSLIETPCSYCLLCWVTYFSCWKVVEVPSLRWIMPSLWRLAICQGTELVVELQAATKRIWNLSCFGTQNLTSRTTCWWKTRITQSSPKTRNTFCFAASMDPQGSNLTSGCPFWWREWYCDSVGYDSRASTRCGLVWCFGFLELKPGGSVVLVVGGEIGGFRKIWGGPVTGNRIFWDFTSFYSFWCIDMMLLFEVQIYRLWSLDCWHKHAHINL